MKWPFVRRSKYELLKTEYIYKLEDQIERHRKLHDEYAQLNHDNIHEINRLSQDLANEMNSHRETKEMWQESLAHNDLFLSKIKDLEKELEETKQHEQKLFEAHDKLNQQNMGLLFENEKLSKQINQLRFDKSHLKTKVKKLESKLVYFDSEYTIMKKNADWFYGNYCRFKDMIEKSGYFPDK